MKISRHFVLGLLMVTTLLSCKDNAGHTDVNPDADTSVDSDGTINVADAETQKVIMNSVFAKLMVTPETRTYTRYLIGLGITDMLSKGDGPFTLIIPSNAAFEGLSQSKLDSLSNPVNKELLTTILKNHIVEGDFTSASLLQSVKKNGSYTLKTMGGANLMVYLEASDIMVKDSKGVAAKMGKSDILAGNGKVHIIDAVLTAAK